MLCLTVAAAGTLDPVRGIAGQAGCERDRLPATIQTKAEQTVITFTAENGGEGRR